MPRIWLALKAFFQLGPRKSLAYARYRLMLRTGLYRRLTPLHPALPDPLPALHNPYPAPLVERYRERHPEVAAALLKAAEEVLNGDVRLFGADPVPINLQPGAADGNDLDHWSAYTGGQFNGRDIKFTWESARFGWATILARAYAFNGDERYAEAFWSQVEAFIAANPPNRGPNWASAQEIGLRLIAWVYCAALLSKAAASTPERKAALAASIAQHAARIPATLAYARAQNNNHLLSEAAALYTASLALPDHPDALRWHDTGWRWFHRGLARQIDRDGAYMQHSANYHRLMLQLGLWINVLAARAGEAFPEASRARLAQATLWLHSLYDAESGSVPNLGPNDGAYILPLTNAPFADFRPVLGACQRAFFRIPDFPEDEMSLWLVPPAAAARDDVDEIPLHVHRLNRGKSWALLHGPRYWDRPGHADVLHVDLWWRGHNLAPDAGSYLYNADPPWSNALATSAVHNTLTVDGRDHMTAAGRFLWLDWPRTRLLDFDGQSIRAATDAYHRFGLRWARSVQAHDDGWLIEDQLDRRFFTARKRQYRVRLHWLLPDWEYSLSGSLLNLLSPGGKLKLAVSAGPFMPMHISLARAGELLDGEGPVPENRGWVSPTYGVKHPALSLAVVVRAPLPLTLTSRFTLPG